jgi:hypothetical protein
MWELAETDPAITARLKLFEANSRTGTEGLDQHFEPVQSSSAARFSFAISANGPGRRMRTSQ